MIDAGTLTNVMLAVVLFAAGNQVRENSRVRARLHDIEGSARFIEGFLRGKGIIPSVDNTSD